MSRRAAAPAALLALLLAPLVALGEDCSDRRGGELARVDRSAWAEWCTRCGGTVEVTTGAPVCRPGADWGKAESGSGLPAIVPIVPTGRSEIDLPLLGIGLGLQMLNEGFKDATNAEQRRRARREAEEYARQIAADRAAAAEAARREESHRAIAGQLKGTTASGKLDVKGKTVGGLKLKLADAGRPRSAFDLYLAREAERREGLAASGDAWCGLNAPLAPARPLTPIPEAQYEQLLAYYQASKANWDQRCAALAAAPANPATPDAAGSPDAATPAPTAAAAGPSSAGKPSRNQDPLIPLPIACDDCWSNYERESRACLGYDTSVERLVCLNGVRDAWVFCVASCRSAPTMPADLRRLRR